MINSSTRRQIGVYLGFAFLTAAIGFLAALTLVRFLHPAEFGRVGLFFSALILGAPLISFAAEGLIGANLATLAGDEYRRFRQSYALMALIAFIIVECFVVFLKLVGVVSDWLIVIMPLFAFIRFLVGLVNTEYVFEQRAATFGVTSLVNSILSLVITVVLFALFTPLAVWRVVAMLVSDLSLLVYRYVYQGGLWSSWRVRRDDVAKILLFGAPSIVAVAGAWALNESDKVIVAKVLGLDAAGLYSAAAALASIMMVFYQSLTNALCPKLFSALRDAPGQAVAVVNRYIFYFTFLSACFGSVVLAAFFLAAPFILPGRYLGAADIIVWMIIASIFVGVYRPVGLAAEYFRLSAPRMWAILMGGAAAIAVEYQCVQVFGPQGAAVGVGVGYAVAAGFLWLWLRGFISRSQRVA